MKFQKSSFEELKNFGTAEEMRDMEEALQEIYEKGLPRYLKHDLEAWKKGLEEISSYLDCLWGELYGSINSAYWDNEISEKQAEYLREKYLY